MAVAYDGLAVCGWFCMLHGSVLRQVDGRRLLSDDSKNTFSSRCAMGRGVSESDHSFISCTLWASESELIDEPYFRLKQSSFRSVRGSLVPFLQRKLSNKAATSLADRRWLYSLLIASTWKLELPGGTLSAGVVEYTFTGRSVHTA